ncbi:ATP-binding protein [Streptomyces iconiensis]|uniref:ATP-binding protein n=1 Tax=Streptomyces iconiensis TaxID=1384038 RepID=A0ABT6ZSA0_9ACTN|nr:ATP-binding protein [Streptomyces iconiensis]MDJ1131943.1 ATP-binding protein [Streptomyces iconiensis]
MGTEGSTVLEPLWQGLPMLDAASVSGSASCALPPRYEAVKSARDFTRRTLQRWEITEEFDDVALVVSELVTNAMRHGLTPGADHGAASGDEGDPPVRLHLMRWSARLVCAVRDPSSKPPDTTAVTAAPAAEDDGTADFAELAGFAAESGRGLCLVDSFSDNWGWHPLSGPLAGKIVWALFRLRPV